MTRNTIALQKSNLESLLAHWAKICAEKSQLVQSLQDEETVRNQYSQLKLQLQDYIEEESSRLSQSSLQIDVQHENL